MGRALVDQARFFRPGDDADRVTQNLVGALDEDIAVARFAQGLGGYGAHMGGRKALQALGKARQAIPAALHGLGRQQALLIETGALADHLLEILHAFNMARGIAANFQAETIGSQIHRGKQGAIKHKCRHLSVLQSRQAA